MSIGHPAETSCPQSQFTMLMRTKHPTRPSLLSQYAEQLGHILERRRTETALVAAKHEAERSTEQMRAAMFEAQAASRANSQFLANMSHELRTPLNAIIGFADSIRLGMAEAANEDRTKEYANYIHDSGKHLLDIINDILDLSKLEAGKTTIVEDCFDLKHLVNSCLIIINERAQQSKLVIETNLSEPLPRVRADQRKLKQVLLNLLSNSVKFTPEFGHILVSVWVSRDGQLTVCVEDTGIGIAPEHIDRVMAPFWQVDGDLNRKYAGTGLGLPLSQALVRAHGGRMTLESVVGAGTKVSVHLPAYRVIEEDRSLSHFRPELGTETGLLEKVNT